MIIKPSIRSNFFTSSHPLGIQKMMEAYIDDVKKLKPFNGPKNVLIIGGSSGYGLASRISLAYGANANTVSVSFESEPKGKRGGSAGYWNNIFFEHYAKETNHIHKDFNGDAFGLDMKQKVLDYIKETFGKVDLIIYSLASGARKDLESGELVRSHIKPLSKVAKGKTIDLQSMEVVDLNIEPATDQETKDTVFVMGGSDWADWIHFFDQNDALATGFKTISYTYIGGPNTDEIYRRGTLGKAKEDLEQKADQLNQLLKDKYDGEALISSSKAVVSKASVFIPQMPIYVSCLFDVMMAHKLHETTLEHKYRLFKDMVYGDQRIIDEQNRIRLDHLEMDPRVQKETNLLMSSFDDQDVLNLKGAKLFIKEFFNINGFNVDGINYDEDVDIEKLIKDYKTKDYQYE
jgi:enoyl-[acyl-carrier protein] reductase / trans-2-enoyl-CoA reductase (NAD+)